MALARSVVTAAIAARVQVIAPASLGATAIAALRARGIEARVVDAPTETTDVIAWAFDAVPPPATTVELAATCRRVAELGRPVCLFVPTPHRGGHGAIERAAAIAYLRVHGAAIAHDVDAWLEAVVLLVRFGLPIGPHAVVIAPPGSWLEAQALTLTSEALQIGARPPTIHDQRGDRGGDEPTDVVLYDPALGAPPSTTPGLLVPVTARAELATDGTSLYTARAALGAIAMLGRAAERIAVGIGPAPREASEELAIDRNQLARQLGDPNMRGESRIGDHETKVLLRAYKVEITRQLVATTPSAAVKAARRVGYPVEVKPWGHEVPTEPSCPVVRDVTSDALVRSAFVSVLGAIGHVVDSPGAAVIVREPPPAGRELAVSLVRLPSLGWTIVLDAPGAPQLAAAPCPLRLIDAQSLARQVVASRAGDPEPDRIGLTELLRRVSHLVIDLDARLVRIELPRVVVGGRGARTLVVDAFAELA